MPDLSLDVIRKKVFFHNSIDVWISACDENSIDWFNAVRKITSVKILTKLYKFSRIIFRYDEL